MSRLAVRGSNVYLPSGGVWPPYGHMLWSSFVLLEQLLVPPIWRDERRTLLTAMTNSMGEFVQPVGLRPPRMTTICRRTNGIACDHQEGDTPQMDTVPVRPSAIALGVLTLLLTSGCADGFATDITSFDRQQTASDELPESVLTGSKDSEMILSAKTSRLAGSYEEVDYYVSRSDSDENCLVAFESDSNWSANCSDAVILEVQLGEVAIARLVPGGIIPADDHTWVALQDVIVRTD